MQATRGNTTSSASSLQSSNSISSRPAVSKLPPPPPSPGFASSASPAPPPYSAGGSSAAATAAVVGKRAPPPPPALKPRPAPAKPAVQYVVALYDFEAQAQGDLSFATGDRIEILERSNNTEDWCTLSPSLDLAVDPKRRHHFGHRDWTSGWPTGFISG